MEHVPKAQSPYHLKEDLSQNLGVEGHQSPRYKADNQSSKFRVVETKQRKPGRQAEVCPMGTASTRNEARARLSARLV